ncbi:MAG: FkbM family methyltransferase [Deltaproteobacteria bacterium]|nr:FkbM family methyltransferase [Deltaproteobacteria bacterium]
MEAKYLRQAQRLLAHPLMDTFDFHEKAGVIENDIFYLWDGTRCRADWVGDDLIDYIKMVRGMNDPLETRTYLDILAALKDYEIVVFEIGAGGGQFGLHALRYHQKVRVVLVEAHSRHYNITCDHMILNDATANSQVIHAAVTAEAGKLVRFCSNAGYGSFIHHEGDTWVPTVSIASLMRDLEIPHLHILHMDIQGAEAEVLKSVEKVLKATRISYLFVSTHNETLHLECKHTLVKHRYGLLVDNSPAESTIGGDGLIVARVPTKPIKENIRLRNKQSMVKRYRRAITRRLGNFFNTLGTQLEIISDNNKYTD